MRILDRQGAGKTVLGAVAGAFLALGATACTAVPIQEMSDARQAISAARAALGEGDSIRKVERAQMLLEQAEFELRDGQYAQARRVALQAKMLAIEAREESDGGNVSQ